MSSRDNLRSVQVPDVEDGDEGDIEDIVRPYAQLKSLNTSDLNSAEFEVILDERMAADTTDGPQQRTSNLASNFFYDDKLLNLLSSGGSVGAEGMENTSTAAAADGSDDELEPFERLVRTMEDLTDHGGVLKKIIKPGVGGSLTVGTSVKFHYSSFLEYGDEPIDSTHLRNKMTKSKIGHGDVLPGLVIALASMRLKETSHFLVKPAYAFGKLGCPPRIPANATILYEVRIESALDCAAADDHDTTDWDWENHHSLTFQERLEAARAYHRKGNSYYSSSNLQRARRCYMRGLWLMEDSPLKDADQENISYNLQAKLLANMAKIHLDKGEATRACTQCRTALDLPYALPNEIKAKIYFRYATAKSLLNSFSDARKYFLLTQKIKPNCPAIAKHIEQLTISERKYQAQERFMCKKMFADYSGGVIPRPAATEREQEHASADEGEHIYACQGDHASAGQGVIITELDSDDDGLAGTAVRALDKLTVSDAAVEGKMDSTEAASLEELSSSCKVKPDFVDIVLTELDRLVSGGSKVKEVMFPSNLSAAELAFIASTASDYGCRIEFIHRGLVKYPKVVKS